MSRRPSSFLLLARFFLFVVRVLQGSHQRRVGDVGAVAAAAS